ncbi:YugN family protein [Paenibacillus gansuensis]|uniref:YugN family protein n=1 Tax=Paenibacillus gansuensis TaxID=306542 RepID=A0ABW5PG07_9BACL
MITLTSDMNEQQMAYEDADALLSSHGFTLGGNWDYNQGEFDYALDEANKVWLRIPFSVTRGTLDIEAGASDATILLGSPYVLKHVYRESDNPDPEAQPKIVGALFDQFQKPVDKDADVEQKWVDQARQLLVKVEEDFKGA